jgi:hypothetical protein
MPQASLQDASSGIRILATERSGLLSGIPPGCSAWVGGPVVI